MADAFFLNISFITFDLKYSGEACLQERVFVNSRGNNIIGRYCGRRYQWSVFASSSPVTLEFHTSKFSSSKFMLQYQITDIILETFLYIYKNYNNVGIIENINYVLPFSWNHIYFLANVSHLMWNIIVPKMYIIMLKILKVSMLKQSVIIFDGPDINSNQLHINTEETITGGTFQLLVLYLNTQNEDIEMIITNKILKNKIENHNNISNIKESIKLNSDDLPCVQLTNVLCAFKLHVPGTYFVNITLLSLKYYGPNVGYCKYGGLSVYDYVHTDKKEVLLLCDNISPVTFNIQPQQIIESSTQILFLIFYAYWPYSRVRFNITIEPTVCKGIHILR